MYLHPSMPQEPVVVLHVALTEQATFYSRKIESRLVEPGSKHGPRPRFLRIVISVLKNV